MSSLKTWHPVLKLDLWRCLAMHDLNLCMIFKYIYDPEMSLLKKVIWFLYYLCYGFEKINSLRIRFWHYYRGHSHRVLFYYAALLFYCFSMWIRSRCLLYYIYCLLTVQIYDHRLSLFFTLYSPSYTTIVCFSNMPNQHRQWWKWWCWKLCFLNFWIK